MAAGPPVPVLPRLMWARRAVARPWHLISVLPRPTPRRRSWRQNAHMHRSCLGAREIAPAVPAPVGLRFRSQPRDPWPAFRDQVRSANTRWQRPCRIPNTQRLSREPAQSPSLSASTGCPRPTRWQVSIACILRPPAHKRRNAVNGPEFLRPHCLGAPGSDVRNDCGIFKTPWTRRGSTDSVGKLAGQPHVIRRSRRAILPICACPHSLHS